MPDLITHMSINYMIYQFLKKYWILPLFILGAVLPDLFIASKIVFCDYIKLLQIEAVEALFVFSHSIVGVLFLSIIIGVFFHPPFKAITSIFFGSLFHLFLDFFQNSWEGGNLILYPIAFKTYSLKLFTFGIEFHYIYVIFFFLIIIIIFFQKNDTLFIFFSFKKIIISLLSLTILILINIIFYRNTLDSDYGYLNFRSHPEQYNKKIIELDLIPLIQKNPPKVYFRHQSLTLLNFTPDPKFNSYDIKGIYNFSKKTINVITYHIRNRLPKIIISTIGLLIFFLYIVFKIKYKIIWKGE